MVTSLGRLLHQRTGDRALASAINNLLTNGLRLIEEVLPGPSHLGRELPAAHKAAARRGDPVVLVSGYANAPHSWREYAASLARDGFQVYIVSLPTRGLGDAHAAAQYLERAVDGVRQATGARKVDLVGFSEGGILSRMVAELRGRTDAVDSIVTLATPHNGISGGPVNALVSALMAVPIVRDWVPAATHQLAEGSQLLRRLAYSRPAPGTLGAGTGIKYTAVYAADGDGIVSARAAWLPGAANVPIRGPFSETNHYGMLHYNHAAFEAVRGALLR